MVVALAALTRFLEQTVPAAAKGTPFAGIAAAIEFPVYAILLGLLGNLVLTRIGLRDRLAGGFRTDGARNPSTNFGNRRVVTAAGRRPLPAPHRCRPVGLPRSGRPTRPRRSTP